MRCRSSSFIMNQCPAPCTGTVNSAGIAGAFALKSRVQPRWGSGDGPALEPLSGTRPRQQRSVSPRVQRVRDARSHFGPRAANIAGNRIWVAPQSLRRALPDVALQFTGCTGHLMVRGIPKPHGLNGPWQRTTGKPAREELQFDSCGIVAYVKRQRDSFVFMIWKKSNQRHIVSQTPPMKNAKLPTRKSNSPGHIDRQRDYPLTSTATRSAVNTNEERSICSGLEVQVL